MGDCGCVLPLFFFANKLFAVWCKKKKYPTRSIPGGVSVLHRRRYWPNRTQVICPTNHEFTRSGPQWSTTLVDISYLTFSPPSRTGIPASLMIAYV